MRWFLRDEKIYIGPVSDIQLDTISSQIPNSGIACYASSKSIETYVTVHVSSIMPTDLSAFKFIGNYR